MVRRGELFSDDVEFHCADFDWAVLFAEHSSLLEEDNNHDLQASSLECVPEEQPMKWEEEYRRHTDKFHPIKNYIVHAFPELQSATPLTILEAGCGSGSCILPLIRRQPHHRYFAFDFSPTALLLLQNHPMVQASAEGNAANLSVFFWDMVTQDAPPAGVGPEPGTVDFCLLTFVLSACTFEVMPSVLRRIGRCLKPDGRLLFRDYGVLDCAHLRFQKKHAPQLSRNCYVRGNGTVASFFEISATEALFAEAGFLPERLAYHCVQNDNRKTGEVVRKVFVNGVFRPQPP
eukprot:EG_transcript_21301